MSGGSLYSEVQVEQVWACLGCRARRVPVHWGPMWGEVQCIMGNGHMRPLWTDRHTYMTENITFLQLRLQTVKILGQVTQNVVVTEAHYCCSDKIWTMMPVLCYEAFIIAWCWIDSGPAISPFENESVGEYKCSEQESWSAKNKSPYEDLNAKIHIYEIVAMKICSYHLNLILVLMKNYFYFQIEQIGNSYRHTMAKGK